MTETHRDLPCVWCQAGEEAVVLEPLVGHGAQFSCVVLDTPRGPVALPPTELGAYDLEHDVLEAHLDMERREARFEVSIRARWRNVIEVGWIGMRWGAAPRSKVRPPESPPERA
jgi:hypothetical protein